MAMDSNGKGFRGRRGRRRRVPAAASSSLLLALALAGRAPSSVRADAAATVGTGGRYLRGRRRLPPTGRTLTEETEPDAPAEEGLPLGCDMDCLFQKIPWLDGKIERTERAARDFFQGRLYLFKDRRVPSEFCFCHDVESPVAGEAGPDPGAAEEETIEDILRVESKIEALERQEGDGARDEEEALAAVEAALIRVGLPPKCDLECFFDNYQGLADKIEHTQEAVLDFFQQQERDIGKEALQIGEHACDCHGEKAVIEEMAHVKEEIEELEGQDGEDARLEKGVLESVEAELVEATLPPGCGVECLFDNSPWLANSPIERTELDWDHKDEFNAAEERNWNNGAGRVRTAGGLTFLQVYDAGHMVPTDQPEHALTMITQHLMGSEF